MFVIVLVPPGCGNGDSSSTAQAPRKSPAPSSRPSTTQSSGATTQSMEDRLYGTWVAKDVDAKIGDVTIKLTFREDGPVKLAAWSDIPFVGQVRNKTAPYEVHGDQIHSDAIRGGTTVKYWFDGPQLVIQYKQGKTVRFNRQSS